MPRHRSTVALAALVATVWPALAQPPDPAAGNAVIPKILAAPVARPLSIGTAIAIPRPAPPPAAPGNAETANPGLSCRMVCSLFTPRQVVAHLSFPERLVQLNTGAVDASPDLRIDVAGTPGGFREGNFGTVALREIARVEVAPGTGLDVEGVRRLVEPAFLAPVQAHRIVPRDPALAPQRLRQMLITRGPAASAPADMHAALERDAGLGGLAQMHFIAQGIELRRSQPQRTVVLEGLQPGLTYGVRIVRERPAAAPNAAVADGADTLVENICRVPVCPADFMAPR